MRTSFIPYTESGVRQPREGEGDGEGEGDRSNGKGKSGVGTQYWRGPDNAKIDPLKDELKKDPLQGEVQGARSLLEEPWAVRAVVCSPDCAHSYVSGQLSVDLFTSRLHVRASVADIELLTAAVDIGNSYFYLQLSVLTRYTFAL